MDRSTNPPGMGALSSTLPDPATLYNARPGMADDTPRPVSNPEKEAWPSGLRQQS